SLNSAFMAEVVSTIRFKAQGARRKAQGVRLKAQGVRLKAQGTRYKAQGLRHQVMKVFCQKFKTKIFRQHSNVPFFTVYY
ncbi:MAG: hypothetical protein KJP23_01310, partial [Deltaproteobacteria bacterium]|nr:hypothetical protein [Deltaproteobacteria bacterium]